MIFLQRLQARIDQSHLLPKDQELKLIQCVYPRIGLIERQARIGVL